MATISVTDADFKEKVLDSDKPVLVDFWAEWCGPCKMIAPVLEEISEEYADRLTIAKMNVDENPQTAGEQGIMAIPRLNLYAGGEVVRQITGAKPKRALLKDLEGAI